MNEIQEIKDINDLNIFDLYEISKTYIRKISFFFSISFIFVFIFLNLNSSEVSTVSLLIKSADVDPIKLIKKTEYDITEIDLERYNKSLINLKLVDNRLFSLDQLYNVVKLYEVKEIVELKPNLIDFSEILKSAANFRNFSLKNSNYQELEKRYSVTEPIITMFGNEQIISVDNVKNEEIDYLEKFLEEYFFFSANEYGKKLIGQAFIKKTFFIKANKEIEDGLNDIIVNQVMSTRAIALGYVKRIKDLRRLCLKFKGSCKLADSEVVFNTSPTFPNISSEAENLKSNVDEIEVIDELVKYYETFLSEKFVGQKYKALFKPIMLKNSENLQKINDIDSFINEWSIYDHFQLANNIESEYISINKTKTTSMTKNVTLGIVISIILTLLFFITIIVSKGYKSYKKDKFR